MIDEANAHPRSSSGTVNGASAAIRDGRETRLTSTVHEERQEPADCVVDNLREVLTELTDLGGLALRAVKAADLNGLCDAAELLLETHVRFAERYRAFLVVRIGASYTTPGLGPDGRPMSSRQRGIDRSSW